METVTRTLIIDDPPLMKDILNNPAFTGRIQNEVFMQMSKQGHGNQLASDKKFDLKNGSLILRFFSRRSPPC